MMKTTTPAALPDAAGGLLAGIRVVEVSDETGAHASLLFAGLGADVIKVEPPTGCPTRRIGPYVSDDSGREQSIFFLQHNRGKGSVALDFYDGADVARFRQLVGSADVLLESTDEGFLADRGCGPEQLRAVDGALV